MTDLHTHILPRMDDGARNVETSLDMLRFEWLQNVKTVALTPHFYRDMDRPSQFLRHRAEAFETLRQAIGGLTPLERHTLPRMILGAEVSWMSGMAEWSELEELCYEGTNYLLLEPPFHAWEDGFISDLYDLISRRNIVPVIAHIDRYLSSQKPEMLEQLFSLGLPTQISAEPFLHLTTRGRVLRCIESGRAKLLISDCHDMIRRPPNLGDAMAVIRKKLGRKANGFFAETDELLSSDAGNEIE